jgi:two-component system LytT family response regulator
MLKAIIVEDEKPNARLLKNLLAKYCPDIELIGICDSVKSSLHDIPLLQPDLIFMDVLLADGNAFDILTKLDKINFSVIFTSAYNDFAVKAIKFSALDYIVKPVNITELKEAVKKAVNKSKEKDETKHFDILLQNVNSTNGKLHKIALPSLEGHTFADLADIVRLEADGSYTDFHLVKTIKIVVSKPIKEYDDLLSSQNFFRVHNSHLINISHVKKYVKGSGGYVVMDDGSSVEVATRRKEDFLKVMGIH